MALESGESGRELRVVDSTARLEVLEQCERGVGFSPGFSDQHRDSLSERSSQMDAHLC